MSPFYCSPPLARLLRPFIHRRSLTTPLNIRLDIYNTYSHPRGVFIKGRALEKKSTDVPLEIADSWWMNLKRTWHALESDEVPQLELIVSFEDQDYTVRTDDEGLFSLEIIPDTPLSAGVYPTTASLPSDTIHQALPSEAQVFILPIKAPSLGVVSDIDDTILRTQVTRHLQMLKQLLFSNGLTAKAVPGMAEVYQSLHNNGFGFHYLSGSPINLHQRLRYFMNHQGFPEGSIELRHWGLGAGTDAILSSSTYKLQRLQKLFQRFPQRRFLLIGDSGEKDPEIYATVRKTFPKQVLGIAIRNVTNASPQEPRFKNMQLFQNAQDLARNLEVLINKTIIHSGLGLKPKNTGNGGN